MTPRRASTDARIIDFLCVLSPISAPFRTILFQGPSHQLRKLDMPQSRFEPHVGHCNSLASLIRHVRRFGPHVGHHNSFASWIRHVRRFSLHEGHHGSPRGKKRERVPPSVRTQMIHVYSQMREHGIERFTQPECKVGETASTPGPRW